MNILRTIIPAALAMLPVSAMAAGTSCDQLAKLAFPDAKIDIAQAQPAGDFSLPSTSRRGAPAQPQVFKSLPAFCRIAATLTPSKDSDIKVEVWMPSANWNGKLEVEGNGGWAGTISYGAMADALKKGYATASTDTGHSTPGGAFTLGHPEKMIDFAWRSEHEETVKAKAVTATFYGNGPKLAYWNGCSTGGRQGLMEATKFPNDFDGIVAGDPVTPRSVHDGWVINVMMEVHKAPAMAIPAEKYTMIHQAVMAACDMNDGVKDGLIENPKACHFDPASLACKGADSASCLTGPQVETVKAIYAPGKANGKEFYPGLLPGTELSWRSLAAGGDAEPGGADNFKYVVYKNPDWDWKTFNVDTAIPAAEAADKEESVTTTDLSAFTKHGGKLILYHGWADPLVSAQGTLNFYKGIQDKTANAANSARVFLVPGMGHCRGGEGATDTFDAVAALDTWVTKGEAPKQIVATNVKDGKVTRSRPLCPYPQVATYKGTGSTDDEVNFTCKAAS